MKLIDSNALLVLILGLMNPSLINKHKKTSIYSSEDYENLLGVIGSIESLVVLPNIWTEVDNLLNKFNRNQKELYVEKIIQTIKNTTEQYLQSNLIEENHAFYDLGLTDTLILEHAKNCELIITSDSTLSDYARSQGVEVFDLKELANYKLK
ncbi:MAG: hypothetical protein ACQETL_13690 [Bacteroidota bacterium]